MEKLRVPIDCATEDLDAVIGSANRETLLELHALLADRGAVVRGLLDAPAPKRRDRAVSIPKAARRLSVHDDTLRAMVKAGKVRHIVVGDGQVRIPESALEELLSGGGGQ